MKTFAKTILALALTVALAATGFPLAGPGGASGFPISQALAAATPESDFLLPVVPKESVPEGYTGIYTKADLDGMRDNMGGSYILMDDIVFAPEDFQTGGAFYNEGRGWDPIGNYDDNEPFTGILNGNGKSIVGLTMDLYLTSSSEIYLSAGLFGYLSGLVQDLRLESADFRFEVVPLNHMYLGAVAGYSDGAVQNTVVTGAVVSPNIYTRAGGIVGVNDGTLSYCKNLSAVSSGGSAGGLAGYNWGTTTDSVNAGSVTATQSQACAGGISVDNYGSINRCYNTGVITAQDSAAGISADNHTPGAIANCFNTGLVESKQTVSYAAGIATYSTGAISACYNDARIVNSGSYAYLAGILYLNNGGTVTNCYYNSDLPSKGGGTPLTRTQMKSQESFTGFDFASTWIHNVSLRRPILQSVYPVMYTISYTLNGGALQPDEPSCYMMGSNNLLPKPVRAGYTFDGWYKDAGFLTGKVTSIPQGTVGSVSFFAKWNVPILSAASYNYNSIKVTWAAAGSATNYKIMRATSATGTYSLVYTASSTARSWIDSGRVTGSTYYYKVYPVAGGKTYYHSAYKYAKPIPSKPTVTLSKYSSTSIKVSWTGIAGATKYQIYRATSATGTYYLVYTASSTARSWVNTGRTVGKTYYYKVRAYHLEGTTKVYGLYSTVKYLKL